MTDKKRGGSTKATQSISNMRRNSTTIQCRRLERHLRLAGARGLTTIHAREVLDIMAPAPRVFELRHNHGLNIRTIWDKAKNSQGNKHSCARYLLFPGAWNGGAA